MSGELPVLRVGTFEFPDGLLALFVLVLLAISGEWQKILAGVFPAAASVRPPTIRLAAPQLVAMTATEEAAAAQLLGSSVADLCAREWRSE